MVVPIIMCLVTSVCPSVQTITAKHQNGAKRTHSKGANGLSIKTSIRVALESPALLI